MMLERIAPYLASIGVHKNGTWAAQKIIDHSNTPPLVRVISMTVLKQWITFFVLDQADFNPYRTLCTIVTARSIWQLCGSRMSSQEQGDYCSNRR